MIQRKRTNCESITFENIPSDYAILKIHTLPDDVGGDTLWASGFEVYDRLSPTWQKIADGLTATHYNVTLLRSLQCLEKC
jgi:alpha-ketoglutarate-dependent taurine dioxygenase